MSPPIAAGREKESNLARLLGSGRIEPSSLRTLEEAGCLRIRVGSAGIAELAIFHPVGFTALGNSRWVLERGARNGNGDWTGLD